jgi:transcriptional regulator
MGKPTDLVQGTLDLLILKTLELEPKHGWAIAKRIQQISNDVLKVRQGSLYPALYRLEKEGWLTAKWRETDTGREAKFYALTRAGRAHLKKELASWDRLSSAVNLVIQRA